MEDLVKRWSGVLDAGDSIQNSSDRIAMASLLEVAHEKFENLKGEDEWKDFIRLFMIVGTRRWFSKDHFVDKVFNLKYTNSPVLKVDDHIMDLKSRYVGVYFTKSQLEEIGDDSLFGISGRDEIRNILLYDIYHNINRLAAEEVIKHAIGNKNAFKLTDFGDHIKNYDFKLLSKSQAIKHSQIKSHHVSGIVEVGKDNDGITLFVDYDSDEKDYILTGNFKDISWYTNQIIQPQVDEKESRFCTRYAVHHHDPKTTNFKVYGGK